MTFLDKLLAASQANDSLLCVGLDPDPSMMAERDPFLFNKAIIEATQDLVCAYKPNWAFYEAQGIPGLEALLKTRECIPSHIPVIADVKRGDVGNTASLYARAVFETFGFDAATVSPYLGFDALEPFLAYRDKGVVVVCKTSNPGSGDFQDLLCQWPEEGIPRPLYQVVAEKAREWNTHGNVGLVVGATYPEELRQVREICPDMVILIPGVGTQGGDLAASVRYGVDARGQRAIINISRQVLYASRGKDYPEAARQAAQSLRDRIRSVLGGPLG